MGRKGLLGKPTGKYISIGEYSLDIESKEELDPKGRC
jgi:hypothetical protein